MAGVRSKAPVPDHHLAKLRRAQVERRDHQVHALSARVLEGIGCAKGRYIEGRVRLLDRPGQGAGPLEPVIPPLEGHFLLGQKAPNGLDALLVERSRVVHGDAESVELVGQEGARETHVEASAAHGIQKCDPGGQLERVAESRDHGARYQPHVRLARGDGGQKLGGSGLYPP